MGEVVGINALSEKEQEQLQAAMTDFTKALRESGARAMFLADALADSISANAERVRAAAEKDRVLGRIAKARGRQLSDMEDIKDGQIVWRSDEVSG